MREEGGKRRMEQGGERSEGQRADWMRRGGAGGAQRASYMGGRPQTKSSVSSAGGKQYFWIFALSIQPDRCVAGEGVGARVGLAATQADDSRDDEAPGASDATHRSPRCTRVCLPSQAVRGRRGRCPRRARA